MAKRPRAPTSVLTCRRGFEPARLQQQLRSEAYEHLVPGSRPTRSPAEGAARRSPTDCETASGTSSNSCGGICA